MDVPAFLKTIYLGDRACKSILIDAWSSQVKIQVTCISRVRGPTWDFYTAEDIYDGYLVFEEVNSIAFSPSGVIPNDLINDIRAEPSSSSNARYLITISIGSVDKTGAYTDVEICIEANAMSLEDPRSPAARITF